MIAPTAIEICGGKDDGLTRSNFVYIDLLAVPECLDEVESFSCAPDNDCLPHLDLVGKKDKQEVVVEFYFEPFKDDETHTLFDVNFGSWRPKRTDDD